MYRLYVVSIVIVLVGLCQRFVATIPALPVGLAPALLLTTYESVNIVYPKEMGYEKDFIQTIYKVVVTTSGGGSVSLTTTNRPTLLNLFNFTRTRTLTNRIDDSVYDTATSSIYFVLTSANGCEIVKLQQILEPKIEPSAEDTPQLANWLKHTFYKNTTVSILSMELNEKKRKLYWLEVNLENSRWSIVVARLEASTTSSSNHQTIQASNLEYYTFDRQIQFSKDGYSYISVIYDSDDEYEPTTGDDQHRIKSNNSNRKSHDNKKKKLNNSNYKKPEIVLFITNNQTLNICFLSNLTCRDFFRPIISTVDSLTDYSYDDGAVDYDPNNEFVQVETTEPPNQQTASESFGLLMGIQYDSKDRTLYLSDYGYDRIEKILLEFGTNYATTDGTLQSLSHVFSVKASYIQTLVSASSGGLPINPVMSVAYDNHIFWTDFEDGLKSTVYKSPCIRPVIRVKNATTLKLIQIAPKTTSNSNSNTNNQLNTNPLNTNRLSSMQKNQFLYPPDYYFYASDSVSAAIKTDSSANRCFSLTNTHFYISLSFLYLFLHFLVDFIFQ